MKNIFANAYVGAALLFVLPAAEIVLEHLA